MLEGILQGLMQWSYSLFLDLMTFCADALLGIMSTDLQFFEESVPVVPTLYGIFVAVGWGLLIGNCAFQCMKAMFAGFGFETESPTFLLLRTFLFGFLLIFADSICEIGLSIGKRVIDLLGVPESVTLTMPEESMFTGVNSSWLLVILIGFILGFQLIKLFFEIAERYVLVAVLTLLCPVGLAFGGSKSTKDICTGFIRTYASMIVMMVMNVLFLKLILSALAAMPTGALILPWCLLIVGIAKTARKADQLVSRIGLSPTTTGDPLGVGRGLVMSMMVARTVMSIAGKAGSGKGSGYSKSGSTASSGGNHAGRSNGGNSRNPSGSKGKNGGSGNGNSTHNSFNNFGNNTGSNVHNSKNNTSMGGNHYGGSNATAGATYGTTMDSANNNQRTSTHSNMGGSKTATNNQSGSTTRFGTNSYTGGSPTAHANSARVQFGSTGTTQSNTNMPVNQPGTTHNGTTNYAGGNQPANAYSGRAQFSSTGKTQSNMASMNNQPNVSNTGNNPSVNPNSGRTQFNSSGKPQVNTNRFGSQAGGQKPGSAGGSGSIPSTGTPASGSSRPTVPPSPAGGFQQNTAKAQYGQSAKTTQTPSAGPKSFGNTGGKRSQGASHPGTNKKPTAGKPKQNPNNSTQPAANNTRKNRFGSGPSIGGAHTNATPAGTGAKSGKPGFGAARSSPGGGKNTAKPDAVPKANTANEVIQDTGQPIAIPEDGETDG